MANNNEFDISIVETNSPVNIGEVLTVKINVVYKKADGVVSPTLQVQRSGSPPFYEKQIEFNNNALSRTITADWNTAKSNTSSIVSSGLNEIDAYLETPRWIYQANKYVELIPKDRKLPNEDVESHTYPSDSEEHSGQIEAQIGQIELKDEFSDPTVDITHTKQTKEHEVVPGHSTYIDNGVSYVVQAMGRNAPEIDITCWVTQDQLRAVDTLTTNGVIYIETARYIGRVVPKNVDIEYSRTYHEKHGWIFKTSIQCIGLDGADSASKAPETLDNSRS